MKSVNQSIRQWGNSLGVRIPATLAKAARIELNQMVIIVAEGDQLVIRSMGPDRPSLAEKLTRFDRRRHGGEVMATKRVGAEAA